MAVQPALLLIADIGGYTRFMTRQRMSLAHAHEIIARLLETVIDSAAGLTLAKLEGDAAFFWAGYGAKDEPKLGFVAEQAARMHQAFHGHIRQMIANNICLCDACQQIKDLHIKFVGHFGEAAVHRVKNMTELAGVDVILVHRLLKNDVPVPEYLLMTEAVVNRLDDAMREKAAALPMTVEELGAINTYFLDVTGLAAPVPPVKKRSFWRRLKYGLTLDAHTFHYMLGLKKPCCGYRNVRIGRN